MEPRCCHLSRRFSDSNHSSCSMRQQIGKWLFVSNTSALIHWGILFPLTLKVKYAEFSSFFWLRLAEEIHSTQEHKWLREFAGGFWFLERGLKNWSISCTTNVSEGRYSQVVLMCSSLAFIHRATASFSFSELDIIAIVSICCVTRLQLVPIFQWHPLLKPASTPPPRS